MSHTGLAAIITPVVAIVALGIWLGAVFRASRKPKNNQAGTPLTRDVVGGAFKSSGGRQVAPRRDAIPPEAHQYEPNRENR
jgi:hypothetical protein